MTSNGDFFLEFMEPLVGGMLDLIKGIGASLAKIFNIANYIDIINNNKGVSGFVVFISVICLLLLFGLIWLGNLDYFYSVILPTFTKCFYNFFNFTFLK